MIYFLRMSQSSWPKDSLFLHRPCSTLHGLGSCPLHPFLSLLIVSHPPSQDFHFLLLQMIMPGSGCSWKYILIRASWRINTWWFQSMNCDNLFLTSSMSQEIHGHKFQYHILYWFAINLISHWLFLGFKSFVCKTDDCEMRRLGFLWWLLLCYGEWPWKGVWWQDHWQSNQEIWTLTVILDWRLKCEKKK